jgi:hypothetical protein
MTIRTRVFLILGVTTAFGVFVCVLLFWTLGNGDKATRNASTQFATALVTQSPAKGPKGAIDYIDGIHANYGPVKSARVIDARNTSHGSGQSAYTYFVGDVLLETAKGPMVVELEFNSPSLTYSSETVTGVHELAPADVPDDALSDAEFVALAKAFDARGGQVADDIDGTWLPSEKRTPQKPNALQKLIKKQVEKRTPKPATPSTTEPDAVPATSPEQKKQLRDATTMLECVQKAKGDVEKMSRCAAS